ncbi:MAG TPA: carotenoid biosynthesis protein [Mycobacteriales bacterium]|nr:carotenoid biosynthesis protein [Mycobacteriales bacterium]
MPAALAGLTVFLQVAYPLVHGTARDRLTVAVVLSFFAASTAHALQQRGTAWTTRFLLVAVGGGLAVEAVGVATGLPFGSYRYGEQLGPTLLGVPVVVPLAWAMLAYPAHAAGLRLHHRVLATGWVLAAWDLFLDPQMVLEGYWAWDDPSPGLNGIPLTNHLAWLVVALLMAAALPARAGDDRLPLALLTWVWASSVLANLVFFDRPGVALAGGLAMGVVVVPALRR